MTKGGESESMMDTRVWIWKRPSLRFMGWDLWGGLIMLHKHELLYHTQFIYNIHTGMYT